MKRALFLIIISLVLIISLLTYYLISRQLSNNLNQSINYTQPVGTTNDTLIGLIINDSGVNEQLNGSVTYGQPFNTDNSHIISKFINVTPNLLFISTNSSELVDDFFKDRNHFLLCSPIVRRHYYGFQALSLVNASPENVVSAYARLNVCDSERAFVVINLLINGSPITGLCPVGNRLVDGRVFNNCIDDGVVSAYMFNQTNYLAVMMYGFNESYINVTMAFLNQFFS